jgi:transketolase
MAAIMNGMALHGGLLPFGGTFLMFSEYCAQCPAHGGADEAARDPRVHARFDRPRRRRPDPPAGGADRDAAHDPNMDVWRPCDTVETLVAWTSAVEKLTGPTSCACRGRTCPSSPATRRPSPTSRAAAT